MRNSWPIVAMSCALLLAGCSGVPVTVPIQSRPVAGPALRGMVHGGQQPIVGAHVYLYAASSNGYGGASTSLLGNFTGTSKDGNGNYYVTTGAGGAFSISGDYTCPSASAQVYLYAIGGDPTPGVPNAVAGLMAGLGSCDSPNFSSDYFVVNEVSTVATAYAIAGFATDPTHVSSSSSALAGMGITDAFSTIANLETLNAGTALATTPAPAANGTVPQNEINTLANILAACVNTNGAVTGPTNPTLCYTLFYNAENGGTAASDTATAAINIAHNPSANIDNLYGLQVPNAPFQPFLMTEPNDFTVSITYTGGGLDGSGDAPEGIAVDALGNVWVPNYASDSVSELSPLGVPISGSSGFKYTGSGISGILASPTSVAVDIYYNAWIASLSSTTMTEISRNGNLATTPPPNYTGAGLSDPYGVSIDPSSNVWVTNNGGNSLSEFESNGVELSGSTGFQNGDVATPVGIATDTSGNIWYANYSTGSPSIGEATPNELAGSPTFSEYSSSQIVSPYSVAIDASGNLWATDQDSNNGNGSLVELSTTGMTKGNVLSPNPYGFTGGGIDDPYGLAIDGLGNVWTANYGGNSNSVSEFSNVGAAISGTNGYVSNGLLFPYAVAIDPSGNVWVASDNTNGPLTEFVGAAAPVVTPLAAGAAYQELGTRP
jgi:streptogramin lyase